MGEGWINLLGQVPLVAVFIWYTLELTKRNQEAAEKRDAQMQTFLKEQRDADRAILTQLVDELHGVRTCLDSHDRKTDEAISVMRDRARVPKSTRQKEG